MSERLTTRHTSVTPRDLTTRAMTVRAETVDEKTRSVEAVLATDAPVLVFDLSSFSIIEEVLVAGRGELPGQIPLLETHLRDSLDNVLGSIRNNRTELNKTIGRLFFAEGDDIAERAYQKVRQGHLTDVSLGYRVVEFQDIAPNTSRVVLGKKYTAGERTLRVTTKWVAREGSLVPIGADQAAKIRQESGPLPPNSESGLMNERLRTYLESIGLRSEATAAEAETFLAGLEGQQRADAEALKGETAATEPAGQRAAPAETATETTRTPVPTGADDYQAVAERAATDALSAERQRVADIQRLGGDDVPAEVVNRAITDGWDVSRASTAFLDEVRKRQPAVSGPGIHSREHDRDCTVRALQAGMVMRSGLSPIDPDATERVRKEQEADADAGERYRDMSMVDVCREALRLAGVRVPHTRDETIRAATSTAELTNIFTSTVNAQLLAAYGESPDTTAGWTKTGDVPDYKLNERTRLGKSGALEQLPRGGEARHATRSDVMESFKIARYAKQFVVDDQDIVDDRFNALREMPDEMGRAAARLRPDLVFSILLANPTLAQDSTALFHANHSNLDTTSALTEITLKAALIALATQQENGVPLGLFGQFLLVPTALKFDANQMIRSQEIRDTTTNTRIGTRNPLQDEDLTTLSDPRLDNGVTDPDSGTTYAGSATTWFLAARGGRHTIEVAYLLGDNRRPLLRSFPLTQGRWGIGWDVKLDIGAAALDFRGLHKSTT